MNWVRFLFPAAALALPLSPADACISDWRLVFFASGSAELDARARSILDNGVEMFRLRPLVMMRRITAGADRLGSASANLRLSRRRAEAVRDYLAARGVPYGSMTIVALGETRLMVETADGVAEAQNRYVILEEVLTRAEFDRRAAEREARGDTMVC